MHQPRAPEVKSLLTKYDQIRYKLQNKCSTSHKWFIISTNVSVVIWYELMPHLRRKRKLNGGHPVVIHNRSTYKYFFYVNNVGIPYCARINLLEPEFYIYILAHSVGKMRITQEPNKVALWNKRHFEEKKNGDYAACLKYSVCIFVE